MDEPGIELGSAQQQVRACPACGTKLSTDTKFCPVCILRGAGAGESATPWNPGLECGSEHSAEKADGGVDAQQFENYELMLDQDGRPVELGRGAMGITYKAFDLDLHCPVTLKVIGEKYLGNESARLRFLREARAAARVRHPNVASVFHLGRTGGNYFYAMEFVEGETLQSLIRRSGRLEVKLALEIVTQVACRFGGDTQAETRSPGYQTLNIMVSVEEDGSVTAKIIDLGLAKPVTDAPAEAAISTSGAFAGTPEFASPEQFAGVGVDIRSDLYSLAWPLGDAHGAGAIPGHLRRGDVSASHALRYQSTCSKLLHSRWSFSLKCSWRRTRCGAFKTLPNSWR